MAKYTFEVSELEVTAAKNELEVALAENKVNQAKALTSNRIEVLPLQARVKAAERFLEKFSNGAKVMAKIEKLNETIKLLEADRQIYAKELSRIGG